MQNVSSTATAEKVEQGKRAMEALLSRSATDMDFRRKLIADPRAAVAEMGNKSVSEVPESFNVKFVENAPGTTTIVLPAFADAETELSERDLEAVSGGSTPLCAVAIGIEVAIILHEITCTHDH
jgi:hypothetical protein